MKDRRSIWLVALGLLAALSIATRTAKMEGGDPAVPMPAETAR